MGYGLRCGKWVLGVKCGGLHSLCMLTIGVAFLEGKTSEFFPINQGVAQGCTLLPILFLIYINGLS